MKYALFIILFILTLNISLFASSLKSEELNGKIELLENYSKKIKRSLLENKNDDSLKLRYQTLNYLIELFSKLSDLDKIQDAELLKKAVLSITKTTLLVFPDEEIKNIFTPEPNLKAMENNQSNCKPNVTEENHFLPKDEKTKEVSTSKEKIAGDPSGRLVEAEMIFYSKKELYKAIVICEEIANRDTDEEYINKAKDLILRIKSYQENQVKYLYEKAKALVDKEKKYNEAVPILEELVKEYYTNWSTKPMYDEVTATLKRYKSINTAQEKEIQSGATKELQARYDEATNILETSTNEKQLKEAIAKFKSLQNTSFAENAKEKIKEAEERIVQSLREEAAKYLLLSQKQNDKSAKLKNLIKSKELLKRAISEYPENSQVEKIKRNLNKVESEIDKLG